MLLAATAVGQMPHEWQRLSLLPAQGAPSLAYDAFRARTVLFDGGRAPSGTATAAAFGATWECNGHSWIARPSAHRPAQRQGQAMAFDSTRGRVVMFGGESATAFFNDTWEWDGDDWHRMPTAIAPQARSRHAMAYDAVRARTVLYGGWVYGGWAMGRELMWEWDGLAWQQVAAANGPGFRIDPAMAFDTARGRLVLAGGLTSLSPEIYATDTWEWDGNTWSLMLAANGPGGSFPMAYDVYRQRVVACVDPYPNAPSLWSWDGSAWTQTPTAHALPERARRGTLVHDAARARVVQYLCESGETWESDGIDWSLAVPSPVPPWNGMAHALTNATSRRVEFTLGATGRWDWDGAHWLPQPRSVLQPYVYDPAQVRDEARNQTVSFGGWSGSWVMLNQSWIWNGVSWQQSFPAQSPPPSGSAPMHYDPVRQRVVLFADFASMWEWDGSNWWNVLPANPPSARHSYGLAYDFVQGGILLFAGLDGTGQQVHRDTWLWNGTNWRQWTPRTSPPPQAPGACLMVTDPLRQRVVLLSQGVVGSSSPHAETWEWDGFDWQQQPTVPVTAPSDYLFLVWDPAQERVMLYDHGRRDAWCYAPPKPSTVSPLGAGCAGSHGVPVLTSNLPQVGNPAFVLDVLSARPSAPCLFGLAAATQVQPLGGGCTFYLSPPVAPFVAMTNAAGFASLQLSIPVDPSLRGLQLAAQAAVLDATSPIGFSFTRARWLGMGN